MSFFIIFIFWQKINKCAFHLLLSFNAKTLETIMNKHENKYKELQSKFQTEVLDLIIKTNHLNAKFFGDPDTRDYTSLSLCSCNKHYTESDYFIKDAKKFIHFSSVNKANSIIESGQIRLYNLSHQNDPKEYKFAAQILGENPRDYEKIRRRIYSLSMCEPELENNLTLWRFYADDTRGIAFVFKIVNNPMDWMHFHLSQIYYGKVEKLEKYKINKEEFEQKNNFRFHLGLDRFLGFHKSDQYSVEQEGRLVHVHKEHDNLFSFLPKPINNNSLPEYITLELYNNNEHREVDSHKDQPLIEIEEIILGPNFKDENLVNTIQNKFKNIKIRNSAINGIYKTK
jgi:hypothetical protein